jgi:hypothetical protein
MKCYKCPDYKKGRGTRSCLRCDEFKGIMTRSKPCVDYVKIPRQILEDISEEELRIDVYQLLSPKDSTILFQRFRLNLSLRDIAYLNKASQEAIRKRLFNITESLKKIRGIT